MRTTNHRRSSAIEPHAGSRRAARLRSLGTIAFALLLTGLQLPAAEAQSDASLRQSEASVMASAEVPVAVIGALVAGGKFVVTGIVASGGMVAVTVSAVGVGASFAVYLTVEAAKELAISTGTAVETVVVSGGWLLMAGGETLCYVANEAARGHVHSRELTS